MGWIKHRCNFPPLYSEGGWEVVEVGEAWECDDCRHLYDVARLACGILYWRDIGGIIQRRLKED